jgi:hypothetical protein
LALSWRAAASNAIEEYAANIDPIAMDWSVNAPGWVAYSFKCGLVLLGQEQPEIEHAPRRGCGECPEKMDA